MGLAAVHFWVKWDLSALLHFRNTLGLESVNDPLEWKAQTFLGFSGGLQDSATNHWAGMEGKGQRLLQWRQGSWRSQSMPPQMQHPQNNLLGKGSLAITNSEELFFQSKKTKSFQPLQIQSCVRHSRILSKCKFKTKTNQKNTYFINQFL